MPLDSGNAARAFEVLVVGAGHAGGQVAVMLRRLGYRGSVALVGDEPVPPYERPPLSKEYLSGDRPLDRMLLQTRQFWSEQDIALLLGQRVVSVDPAGRSVTLADGTPVSYGTLVWAAGGDARRLDCEGRDLAGVHSIRTLSDVDLLRNELADIRRVGVIGGGYIGLEAAAVLTKLGKSVTLFEALNRVLARVAGEAISRFVEAEHRRRGVDLRTGVVVSHLRGADGRVNSVVLASGDEESCDAVIVGIGIVPAIAPLVDAGAHAANGVLVDRFCRTSLVDVFAIGDCAAHPNRFADGRTMRLESVQNANDQAMTVARAITGAPAPYEATPWFWSNQYDLRLQTVGLSADHEDAIVRGEPGSGGFSVIYRRGGRVVALDCVNNTRDYAHGRKLVETGAVVDAGLLADTSIPLKTMVPG